MSASVLTMASRIACPHGGHAVAVEPNSRVMVEGQPVLTFVSHFAVAGCPVSPQPGQAAPLPCTTGRALAASLRVSVSGVPVLTSASIGLCTDATGTPSGPLVTVAGQGRVRVV